MLKIGGFTPFATIDYPGHLAAVLFCQGCPWRCGYCHNPELLAETASSKFSWDEVLAFLERRRGLLDAVVFSGGEPTMQPGLLQAIGTVKSMGFLAGLHTGGAFPEKLAELLPHLDWVGMDIKAPFPDYAIITGVSGSGELAKHSSYLVRESGIAHEFRTTLHPYLLEAGRLEILKRLISEGWGSTFRVQAIWGI